MTRAGLLLILMVLTCLSGCDPSGSKPNNGGAKSSGDVTNKSGEVPSNTASKKAKIDPALAAKGDTVFQKLCTVCHKRTEVEGPGLMGAPSMQVAMREIPGRLTDENYSKKIEKLKVTKPDYYEAKAEKIARVLAEKDPDQRLRTYLSIYLDDPKFDDPAHKMIRPVNITTGDIEALIPYLMTFKK